MKSREKNYEADLSGLCPDMKKENRSCRNEDVAGNSSILSCSYSDHKLQIKTQRQQEYMRHHSKKYFTRGSKSRKQHFPRGIYERNSFTVSVISVSPQVTVEAVTGGSVILPCSSTEHDLKLQDIDVHWRNNNDKIVCSIIKGKYSVEGQDPRYKDRAETFPPVYERGNFSLKLNNLTKGDEGGFHCFITHSSYFKQETVQLIIKQENKSTNQENQGEETGGDSWKTSHVVYIVLAVLFLFIVFFIISYCIWKHFILMNH